MLIKLIVTAFILFSVCFALYIVWFYEPEKTKLPDDLLFTKYFEECIEVKKKDIDEGWTQLNLRSLYRICWGQAAMRTRSKIYSQNKGTK